MFKISQYKRNILQLFTGTSIAQVIPLLTAPLLTRLYAPESFGLYASFLAVSALLTILATLRLEIAIVIPDLDEESTIISNTSILLASIISLVIFVIIYVSYFNFNNSFGLNSAIFALPFSIISHAYFTILYYYALRLKLFKVLAITRIMLALCTLIFSILFASLSYTANGLIFASVLSYLITVIFLSFSTKYKFKLIKKKILLDILLKYKNFPKLDLPTALLIQLSNRLPVLLLTRFFSAAYIGYYSLSQRMIDSPTSFITTAISDSFKQKATNDYNETGSMIDTFKETRKLLIYISIIPYLIIQLMAPYLFYIVFGPEWVIAGEYAQILAPLFLLRFIISPLTYTFYIHNKLNYNLLGQIAKLLLSAIGLFIGIIYNSISLGLIAFTIANSFIYIYYYFMSLKFAKQLK